MRRQFPLWPLMIPLLLLNAWLAMRGLNADTYWLDEVLSLSHAGGGIYPPRTPLQIIEQIDPWQAPVYPILNARWGRVVGWSPLAMRYGSLLVGMLTLALTFQFGRATVSPAVGLGAAAILGTSAMFVYFQHELRAYVLSTTVVMLTLWLYWRVIHKPGLWGYVALWAALLLTIYTHYLGVVGLVGIAVYHLLFAPKSRQWVGPIVVAGCALLFFAVFPPGIVESVLTGQGSGPAQEDSMEMAAVALTTVQLFSSGAVVLWAAATVLAVGRGRAAWVLAVSACAVMLLANDELNFVNPGRERYLLVLFPLLALVAAGALAARWRVVRVGTAGLIAVWAAFGVFTTLRGDFVSDFDGAQALPWDEVAVALDAYAAPNTALALHSSGSDWIMEIQTAEYHLHDMPVNFTVIESFRRRFFTEQAQEFAADANHVWLATDQRHPSSERYQQFGEALRDDYMNCGPVYSLRYMSFDLYVKRPQGTAENPVVTFNGAIDLHEFIAVDMDNTLVVRTLWDIPDNVADGTYSVGMYLLDAAGEVVTQADTGLPYEPAACIQNGFALSGLRPGDYTIAARVYNWQTGDVLPSSGGDSDTPTLHGFTISR
ncbi:MAG: glycosyltransferase family 39 protein [Chloroflexota bacterium]